MICRHCGADVLSQPTGPYLHAAPVVEGSSRELYLYCRTTIAEPWDQAAIEAGTVYGIRPHRPMSPEAAEIARRAAEEVPLTVAELRRQGLLP